MDSPSEDQFIKNVSDTDFIFSKYVEPALVEAILDLASKVSEWNELSGSNENVFQIPDCHLKDEDFILHLEIHINSRFPNLFGQVTSKGTS